MDSRTLIDFFTFQGQNGSHFEPKAVSPPLPNKFDWEIEPTEIDFSNSTIIGKVYHCCGVYLLHAKLLMGSQSLLSFPPLKQE